MRFPKLVARRAAYLPTNIGWSCLFAIFVIPVAVWLLLGEQFLNLNEPGPADILVVEGWISLPGIAAAAEEFNRGGYRLAIGAGAYSSEKWEPQRWNFGVVATQKLEVYGVPKEKIICAPADDTDSHRTYSTAAAVAVALKKISPQAVNVTIFTRGVHARRSRLVFSRVLGPEYNVGVINWKPPGYSVGGWWHSSERAKDFIIEGIAWGYEFLFHSGRRPEQLEKPHDFPPQD